MLIQIRNRFTNEVIYECEAASLREAVEQCVRLGKSLAGASLAHAILAGANLDGANLARAGLDGANLDGASLAGANLDGASLAGASLDGAYLAGAYLAGAYLAGAYLAGAYLDGANGAAYVIAQTRILPEGSLIGWKKVSTPTGDGIVKLRIPEEAKRSHAFGRKCRCEFAEVLDAPEGAYTDEHGPRTEYRVGEIVRPDKWNDNWQEECSNGIHFFITRLEAENYDA